MLLKHYKMKKPCGYKSHSLIKVNNVQSLVVANYSLTIDNDWKNWLTLHDKSEWEV